MKLLVEQRYVGASGDVAFSAEVAGEANRRFQASGLGVLQWGPSSAAYDVYIGRAGTRLLSLGGTLTISPGNAADQGLNIKGVTAQVGDLLHIEASTAIAALSRFNKDGYFLTAKVAAPADGDVSNSEVGLWWDASAGALNIKGKTSGGTVVNTALGSGGSAVTYNYSAPPDYLSGAKWSVD